MLTVHISYETPSSRALLDTQASMLATSGLRDEVLLQGPRGMQIPCWGDVCGSGFGGKSAGSTRTLLVPSIPNNGYLVSSRGYMEGLGPLGSDGCSITGGDTFQSL